MLVKIDIEIEGSQVLGKVSQVLRKLLVQSDFIFPNYVDKVLVDIFD